MLKKDAVFAVYVPPAASLPFLSVIFRPGRKHDALVTCFPTAAEAEAFNDDMRTELRQSRSGIINGKVRVPAMTPDQSRAARELLKWTADRLSEASGVGIRRLSRFEMSDGIVQASTMASLRSALEAAGIEFIVTNGVGTGVRMRKAG